MLTEARGRAYAGGRARARREPATSSPTDSPASVRTRAYAYASGELHKEGLATPAYARAGARPDCGNKVPEGKRIVFAIDPGGTTAMVSASVELKGTAAETFATKRRLRAQEFTGRSAQQALDIWRTITSECYVATVEQGIPASSIYVVLEDFILRRRQEGGATGNLTSCWVAGGLDALTLGWFGDNQHWQQPSEAKRYATNDRLKRWGLYEHTVGSEHIRDATRHWATLVNKIAAGLVD